MSRDQEHHKGLTSAAIRRPIGTLAIASVVFVLGLFFIERLPIDLLPNVEMPQIIATVNYPGTAPEVMEEQVTRVLERNLAATENLVPHRQSRLRGAHQRQPALRFWYQSGSGTAGRLPPSGAGPHPVALGH